MRVYWWPDAFMAATLLMSIATLLVLGFSLGPPPSWLSTTRTGACTASADETSFDGSTDCCSGSTVAFNATDAQNTLNNNNNNNNTLSSPDQQIVLERGGDVLELNLTTARVSGSRNRAWTGSPARLRAIRIPALAGERVSLGLEPARWLKRLSTKFPSEEGGTQEGTVDLEALRGDDGGEAVPLDDHGEIRFAEPYEMFAREDLVVRVALLGGRALVVDKGAKRAETSRPESDSAFPASLRLEEAGLLLSFPFAARDNRSFPVGANVALCMEYDVDTTFLHIALPLIVVTVVLIMASPVCFLAREDIDYKIRKMFGELPSKLADCVRSSMTQAADASRPSRAAETPSESLSETSTTTTTTTTSDDDDEKDSDNGDSTTSSEDDSSSSEGSSSSSSEGSSSSEAKSPETVVNRRQHEYIMRQMAKA